MEKKIFRFLQDELKSLCPMIDDFDKITYSEGKISNDRQFHPYSNYYPTGNCCCCKNTEECNWFKRNKMF